PAQSGFEPRPVPQPPRGRRGPLFTRLKKNRRAASLFVKVAWMVGDLRPMRARAFSLLLPLLLSCAGKNVVSGDDKTPAERLDALLPNWCKDICSRLDSCATNQPCGCSGDSCDCVQPSADCPAECEQEMARFTRGNDACAAAGESYKS